jgi:hypothetical protein
MPALATDLWPSRGTHSSWHTHRPVIIHFFNYHSMIDSGDHSTTPTLGEKVGMVSHFCRLWVPLVKPLGFVDTLRLHRFIIFFNRRLKFLINRVVAFAIEAYTTFTVVEEICV